VLGSLAPGGRLFIPAHKTVYLAGITTSRVTGAPVYVTSSGQLGLTPSSKRYKTAIAPMGSRTDKLAQLRPVSFHLKADPQWALQYGLIAEEVDKIYPDLVIRDADRTIQGVRYDELTPMLLNEVRQQQAKIAAQEKKIAVQEEKFAAQAQQLQAIHEQVAILLKINHATQSTVAMR
jgi:Chaperone of endosialidase